MVLLSKNKEFKNDLRHTHTWRDVKKSRATALMKACYNGNSNTVNLLIYTGKPLDAQDDAGWTALMYCCAYNSTCISQLIKAGASLNLTDLTWDTALKIAYRERHYDIIKSLIIAGALFNLEEIPECEYIIGEVKRESMVVYSHTKPYVSTDVLDHILMKYIYSDNLISIPSQEDGIFQNRKWYITLISICVLLLCIGLKYILF
jgi:ankyrin repeat protein